MKLWLNPILREGIRIYVSEGYGFPVYFAYVVLLGTAQLLILIATTTLSQSVRGPAYAFMLSSAATLLLMIYFSLRLANREFFSWRFQPVRYWFAQGQVGLSGMALGQILLLCLHLWILTFLSFPLLGWAGAVSRTPASVILAIFPLMFLYALGYGLWGLIALAWGERRFEGRRIFVRFLFLCFIVISGLLYLPINPLAMLVVQLGGLELPRPLSLGGWEWSATTVHWVFVGFLLGLGLLFYSQALRRLRESF